MKKKIAVFANGWSNEYLKLVLEGIRKRAAEDNIDLFIFLNYSSGDESKPDNVGEKSIFMLPKLKEFDGVLLMANTINLKSERSYLKKEILKYGIPAASFEYELDGIPTLGTDTYSGVYELVTHIVEEHGVRDVVFVSGPADNVESQSRLKAASEALAKVGAKIPPRKVLQGGWSYHLGFEKCQEWLDSRNKLPDAFVCANDEMAIGVCAALDSAGIKVPEQVIVTGCDYIEDGQKLYPILSTVARNWDKLGYDGLDLLLKQMAGKTVPLQTVYNSMPVIGESCGCKVKESKKEKRRRAIIGSYRMQGQNNTNEWHLRHIDEMLTNMTSVQRMKDELGWNFAYNHKFEGDNFMVCLVDKFFSAEDGTHPQNGGKYPENMEVCVQLKDGKAQKPVMFPSEELLPDYDGETAESHIYLFIPLHVEDRITGYAMFIDELSKVYDKTLYTWTKHVSQDLERVRQNIRLDELNKKLIEVSMTDALTGLRNRTGYDALAFPYLQKCQREGKIGTMIFADINRMKHINDKYGHLQGDVALRTVADAIKMTMPKDWIAVRFGGDEFIMVGECKDGEEAEEIKNRLALNLEKLKEERDLSFPLTASFGAVVVHPDETYTLEEYLRKADEAMYVMKQICHKEDQ